MNAKRDPETGHTEDQSRALGAMMELRGLLSEFEERLDGDDSVGAHETAEKIVICASLLHGDATRWMVST